MGLTRTETLDIQFSELKTLVAIERVKNEGARLKRDEEEEFFDLLKIR